MSTGALSVQFSEVVSWVGKQVLVNKSVQLTNSESPTCCHLCSDQGRTSWECKVPRKVRPLEVDRELLREKLAELGGRELVTDKDAETKKNLSTGEGRVSLSRSSLLVMKGYIGLRS